MNIALDATPLTAQTGGVRRYVQELSRALAELHPEDTICLMSDQPFEHPAPGIKNLRVGRGARNVLERRWWSFGLQAELKRLRVDVFHGTDFAVPYLPVRPSVMTVHDLSPWKNPTWHADGGRVKTRTPVLLRLGLATLLITPSEAIRREVMEVFHIP